MKKLCNLLWVFMIPLDLDWFTYTTRQSRTLEFTRTLSISQTPFNWKVLFWTTIRDKFDRCGVWKPPRERHFKTAVYSGTLVYRAVESHTKGCMFKWGFHFVCFSEWSKMFECSERKTTKIEQKIVHRSHSQQQLRYHKFYTMLNTMCALISPNFYRIKSRTPFKI